MNAADIDAIHAAFMPLQITKSSIGCANRRVVDTLSAARRRYKIGSCSGYPRPADGKLMAAAAQAMRLTTGSDRTTFARDGQTMDGVAERHCPPASTR